MWSSPNPELDDALRRFLYPHNVMDMRQTDIAPFWADAQCCGAGVGSSASSSFHCDRKANAAATDFFQCRDVGASSAHDGSEATSDNDVAKLSPNCSSMASSPMSCATPLPNMPSEEETECTRNQGPPGMSSCKSAQDVRELSLQLQSDKSLHSGFVAYIHHQYDNVLLKLAWSEEELLNIPIRIRNAKMDACNISRQDRAIVKYIRLCAGEAADSKNHRQSKSKGKQPVKENLVKKQKKRLRKEKKNIV